MPYEVNSYSKIRNLEYLSWYRLSSLGSEIKSARKINFSITEQRQQTLQRFGNLDDVCPFDIQSRFPENDLYICEGFGDWSRKFQQMKTALTFKSYDKDDKSKKTGEESSIKSLGDYNDSQQAFWNSTTSMLDQIKRNDGVWDRNRFEAYFGLHWVANP
jgi:hypothetical protein